jgi:hypothetical protein
MKRLPQQLHFLSAFAAPVLFSAQTGHFWSALRSRALDRKQQPLPWYTYPSIDYLRELDFSDADVLEFGGGQSTLWWAKRAKSVTCLESNENWCKELRARLQGIGDATVHFVTSPAHSAEIVGDGLFDVIVIDDGSGVGPHGRVDNANTAFDHLRSGGFIVVDNSNAAHSAPIAAAAAEKGLGRIDFFGWAPGSLNQSCTSILFNSTTHRLRPLAAPVSPYITGKSAL